MAKIERMTVALPTEMAELVRQAVGSGDYASGSEVVRDALRDWRLKRATQLRELEQLRADIKVGLTAIEAGDVKNFDAEAIAKRGRDRSAAERVSSK